MCPTVPKPKQTLVLIFLGPAAALGPVNLFLFLETLWDFTVGALFVVLHPPLLVLPYLL